MLDNGATVSYRSSTGHSPLMKGVTSRNAETVKLLLEAKSSIHDATTSGMTALSIAEFIKDVDMVELLKTYQSSYISFEYCPPSQNTH